LGVSPYNPDFFGFETYLLQNDPGSILPFTSLDLYDLLPETPPDVQLSQGTTPGSFLTLRDFPDSSSFLPQIAAPVDDGTRICDVCSRPTLLPPQVATFPPPGWLEIPQTAYTYGVKQFDFTPLEPILFYVNGRPGVNMGQALRKVFTGLDGRDDPMLLQNTRLAVSCRLLFPGYPLNSSPQIPTKNWNKRRGPITRGELAHHVSRKLEQYLDSMAASHTMDGSTDKQWKIGEGFMGLDNMFLVRLVSVSTGSFQPEIWVADPTTT
jgi:hypothetical protein